jgi:hypothetical protein
MMTMTLEAKDYKNNGRKNSNKRDTFNSNKNKNAANFKKSKVIFIK